MDKQSLSRLEAKIRDLESRLELEQMARQRAEVTTKIRNGYFYHEKKKKCLKVNKVLRFQWEIGKQISSSDVFFTRLIKQWCVITYNFIIIILFNIYWHIKSQSHLANFFPDCLDRDKFSNRKQSETDCDDKTPMCDCLSEYLQMCFRWYKDSSCPFPNIPYVLPMQQDSRDIHVPCFCYVSNQSKFWVVY